MGKIQIIRQLPAILLLIAALMALGYGQIFAQQEAAGTGTVYVLTVDDAIGPATRDYLLRGIEQAEEEGAGLVVVRINTPGGLDVSMRDIIRKILASEVPVATWVAPDGSRAASAGTYILYASHIAAMAPATNLGAATPVQIGGGGGGEQPTTPIERARDALEKAGNKSEDEAEGERAAEEGEQEEGQAGDASTRKAVNDAVSYIKGLAERHGRNGAWAERTVREAVSLTASEALELGVIDLIASDLAELLEQIDGREVRMASGMKALQTAGLQPLEIETDWRTDLLAIITNPAMAYILMMVGIYGLILEGYNPGALVPGVIGGISLLLALYAFQILPVNYAGLALIALGLALIAVELFIPSFGILGVGGIVAVMAGSVILFDTDIPEFRLNSGVIAGMGFGSALVFGGVVWLAARTMSKPRLSGREAMIGLEAEAIGDFVDGRGRVHLLGEDWSARSPEKVGKGDKVRITAVAGEGFVLDVSPAEARAGGGTDG
jgi:membrane-bound serine protease (ClpP class)